ncbi:hypothetical protein SBOR_9513 [Sclerotinia borealis F-4128]|uniref:Uncharacterized protein n=1 Tax=Sclerotinia borealis (strain F-4128) TaxID=1432307 RepID=W9BZV0_SCLBF|nr:hypothetical protein SBOR_9513 [Sclerotinia borealis F-4128]
MPWFSPLRHSFLTLFPIWMMSGTVEVLIDAIVKFAGEMEDLKEHRVRIYEIANAPRDIFFLWGGQWGELETDEAASAAAQFLTDDT